MRTFYELNDDLRAMAHQMELACEYELLECYFNAVNESEGRNNFDEGQEVLEITLKRILLERTGHWSGGAINNAADAMKLEVAQRMYRDHCDGYQLKGEAFHKLVVARMTRLEQLSRQYEEKRREDLN